MGPELNFGAPAETAGVPCWAVVPLRAKSKEPIWDLLPRDPRGRPTWKLLAETAPTVSDVTQWVQQAPDMNLGVLTGSPSNNLAVIDVDRPEVSGWQHLPIT